MKIGGLIDLLRREKRLSWEALEMLSGVTRSTLYRWLQGKSDPLAKVERVLAVLDYEIDLVPTLEFSPDLRTLPRRAACLTCGQRWTGKTSTHNAKMHSRRNPTHRTVAETTFRYVYVGSKAEHGRLHRRPAVSREEEVVDGDG